MKKTMKPAFHTVPISIETRLLLLLILSGILFNPVSAKVYPNYSYTPRFIEDDEFTHDTKNIVNYSFLGFHNSVYTTAEQKFTSDLLYLVSPEKKPRITPEIINSTILALKRSNNLKNAEDIYSIEDIADNNMIGKTVMVHVTIGVTPGVSTHILDPYLYPPITREEDYIGPNDTWDGNNVDAWVKYSQLKEIANLSSVILIRSVVYGPHNQGLATTEGDTIHQSDYVRNLVNNTNLSEIKIGVISTISEFR